jgi:tetratricopeptide (TPR) repeat protein
VYDLLLRGRYAWRERKDVRLKESVDDFRKATQLEPKYAPAYADLAGAYVVLPYYSDSSPTDTFPEAKAAAERAVQLDQGLWKAHTVLGLIECSYLDLEAGDREYRRALQLNSNYATAHHWRSFCLWMMNRRGEAMDELETARRLDPRSWIIYADEALTLAADHQPDRAIQLLKTAEALEPDYPEIHRALGVVYVQKREMQLAITEASQAVNSDPNNYCAQATLGYVYASAGKIKEAEKILAELSARRPPVRQVYLS